MESEFLNSDFSTYWKEDAHLPNDSNIITIFLKNALYEHVKYDYLVVFSMAYGQRSDIKNYLQSKAQDKCCPCKFSVVLVSVSQKQPPGTSHFC